MGEPNNTTQVATQFFEELKTAALVLQIISLEEQKSNSRRNSKPTYSFSQSQISPIHLKMFADIVKDLTIVNKTPFGENLQSFPVPLYCKCSTWPSVQTKSHLSEMQTSGRSFLSQQKGSYLETR